MGVQKGVDFNETFFLVINFSTVKCLIVLTVKKGCLLFQLDINNAFLHGDLEEEVYMKISLGLVFDCPSGFVPPVVN